MAVLCYETRCISDRNGYKVGLGQAQSVDGDGRFLSRVEQRDDLSCVFSRGDAGGAFLGSGAHSNSSNSKLFYGLENVIHFEELGK